MSPTSFNDLDPAEDAAFPRIFPFDPDASPAPEPPPEPPPVDDGGPPAPIPPAPDVPDVPDVPDDAEVDPADLVVDESQLDDEELLEADALEPEQIIDIEIGVD